MAKQSSARVTAAGTPTSSMPQWLPHIIIIALFLIIASLFCMPQLQGNRLLPHDTEQWICMSKEARDYYEQTGQNSFWTNSLFGGMPTNMFNLNHEGNWIHTIGNSLLLYKHGEMVNPLMLFFWAMLSFYLFGLSLKIKSWISAIGAVAFAFSSYHPIIISAGHATKMLDLAYAPGLLAGILYAYRGKYWIGAGIAGIFLSLMISAGHYQIIYYMAMVVLILIISKFIEAVKTKTLRSFLNASMLLAVAAGLALGNNIAALLMTSESVDYTMRGSHKELGERDTKSGLDKEYAFRWSNGIEETFTLMVPNLYGGGHLMQYDTDNELGDKLSSAGVPEESIRQIMPALGYWGAQQEEGLGGSVYFGAIICFLAILGLFVIKSGGKWWMVVSALLFIMISWGKNFSALNFFLFDTLPMFSKFRSPNMAISIAAIMLAALAVWGLNEILTGKIEKEELLKKLKISTGIAGGLALLILLAAMMFMDFSGVRDSSMLSGMFGENGSQFKSAVIDFRKGMALKDAFRALVFILIGAAVIWGFAQDKLKGKTVIVAVSILVLLDILPVSHRYLSSEKYLDPYTYESHFAPSAADNQILQDKSYYRVMDLNGDVFSNARPSYFHKSIGGYHPAKLQIYQDLIEHHIGNLNTAVLNMLNTKYLITPQPKGQQGVMPNPGALGNAWFISQVKVVDNAQQAIDALNAPSLQNPADSTKGNFNPAVTVVLRKDEFAKTGNITSYSRDSAANITLTEYTPKKLTYKSSNANEGLAVFSEIYYPKDWVAKVDGKPQEIIRANYALRALKIPAGQHTIEMEYMAPKAFIKGAKIAKATNVALILIAGIGVYVSLKKKREEEEK